MKITFTISLLILASFKAFSCSCLKPEPIDTTFKEASIIFIGKVTEIVEDKLIVNSGERYTINLFEILKELKKGDGQNKTVSIVTDNSSCAFFFEEGKTYVVFGYSDPSGIMVTNQCTRTVLLERLGKNDLSKLKMLSANYKNEGSSVLGLVTITRPEYNALINNISKLENNLKTNRLILITLSTLLFITICFCVYLGKRNKNLQATQAKAH